MVTYTWTSTSSAVWTVAGNWSPSGPPVSTDTAIVSIGSILINAGTVGITDLSLGGSLSGPGSGQGTVSVISGGALQALDAIAVWSGSTLAVDANSAVDIGSSGSTSAGNILVENGHSLLGDGVIAASLINNGAVNATNNGTLASSTGGELTIQGSVTGTGTMTIAPGATLQIQGTLATAAFSITTGTTIAGQTIAFAAGAPETLILGSAQAITTDNITEFLMIRSALRAAGRSA